MKEVTKEEFFHTVGQLNVHPAPVGKWPYTSEWKSPSGRIVGKSEGFHPIVDGKLHRGLVETRYFSSL